MNHNTSRRTLLKSIGILSLPITQRVLLLTSSGLVSSACSKQEPGGLNQQDLDVLLKIVKAMFPHSKITDEQYGVVINTLLDEVSNQPDSAELLTSGINTLNQLFEDSEWADAGSDAQLNALNEISDSEFFGKLKQTTVLNLYNDHSVWEQFGYEGEAFSKGGYIQRGFNDLDWLPNPPEDASPKA